MSELEKIQRYIDKNRCPHNPHYGVSVVEALAIAREMTNFEAIELAFNYGQAKGYRQAKAEVRS